MNPNQPQGNPFQAVLEKIKSRKMQEQQTQQSQQPQVPPMQGPGSKPEPVPPNENAYGQNTKVTGLLTGAIKNIDQAITESTDPNKIKILRGIMALIARILTQENDQGGQVPAESPPASDSMMGGIGTGQ